LCHGHGTGVADATPAAKQHVKTEVIMTFKDLIPWNRSREINVGRGEEFPLLTLHREMNRLFDQVFRSIDVPAFSGNRSVPTANWPDAWSGWPHIEVSEAESELCVSAELPGLEDNDVQVELSNGYLVVKGEKKTKTEDKGRLFSERYYGRFERRIPVEGIEPDRVSATFKNGVLTVTLPKTASAREQVRRIAIQPGTANKTLEHKKAA
jgi:HSP20 family protein